MAGPAQGGVGGHLLRLSPLTVDQVPEHPELQFAQNSAPSLASFVSQCLREALEEDFGALEKTGEVSESVRSEGSKYTLVIEKLKKKDKDGGTWFGRRSLHEEVSYEELDGVVRKDHEKNEMQYTPAIYEANTILEWRVEEQVDGAEEVELRVTQMHHSMPAPALLNDRVFSVLLVSFVLTAPPTGTLAQSIDLQLPVELSTFPAAVKARSHAISSASKLVYKNPEPATAFQKKQDGRKLVEGRYTSLEKISKMEVNGKVVARWDMMTASDAAGALPMGVQKMGVPGAIVKDVPLAVEYIMSKRRR